MMTALKITAVLKTPLCGEINALDGIVEYYRAKQLRTFINIRPFDPVWEYGTTKIPISRKRINDILVPCASSPIYQSKVEFSERFSKRLSTEYSFFVSEKKRKNIHRGTNPFKSTFLPLQLNRIDRVCWFVVGDQQKLTSLLEEVASIGQKRGYGYGQIKRWDISETHQNFSWFCPESDKTILMRPLPSGPELPLNLVGYKNDFGAVQPPYWHPERYLERVVPC